jgi:hypothetical protein
MVRRKLLTSADPVDLDAQSDLFGVPVSGAELVIGAWRRVCVLTRNVPGTFHL